MKINFKIIYVIPVILAVILIIALLLAPKKGTSNQQPVPTNKPMPTAIPLVTSQASSRAVGSSSRSNVSPTLIPPHFTGADVNQQIPQAETDLAVQKSELRKKMPLSQPTFSISFDYANDVFSVTLNEPKEASKQQFQQWLQTNYPNIPLDRFEFK